MKTTTGAWVRKAESDYQCVVQTTRRREPFHDHVCFHSQQSAEKYLKALLQELGLAIPRVQHLDDLLGLLSHHEPSLRRLRRGLILLTAFAGDIHYHGASANRRQAASALRWAGRVRAECRGLLGLRS